ncbi:inactive poly [ADP-ribose] polymerase RCD1-like [Olea europaea subsp. europaea]|uniref:Inactive poly [ADP-ribose] polymerase RCD1-like n=1 Tax=Olea europaea subsp. europaea TaxID=158383 RepID=A0A8S0SK94_OLEEU|nr:inactive poly [ADP-ribose] polymerase RCD1-like [Olea europaea subsp. europaea]
MEAKFARVLDSGQHAVVDLKRKRATSGTCFKGDTDVVFPLRSTASSFIHKLGKRRKLNESKSNHGFCSIFSGKSLLKYYSNFKKSGLPHRLMYYYHGEWNDFPQYIVKSVQKGLIAKKTAVEVDINGNVVLLDFLHMMQLDLNTGVHQPIAWIDESGNCFFPEIFADYDKAQGSQYEFDDGHSEHQGPENIKLHLEIEINGSDAFKLKESVGESNVKQIQVQENPAEKDCDEVNNSCTRVLAVEVDEKSEENKEMEGKMVMMDDHIQGFLDVDTVKKIFFIGIGSSARAEVVEVHRGSSTTMEARLELFQKQVEITKKYRGDANVQYAWLPCSKGTVSGIMKYGVGHYELSKIKRTYGVGIYLIPTDCAEISASYFDVDENDTRHVVFCRVIMGNMELVRSGRKQFHPSSEDFDSGVDNLQNPKWYIVWNTNMNSHIYPEYVVSFKMASDVEGRRVETESRVDVSGVSTCYEKPQAQLHLGSPSTELGSDCHHVSAERFLKDAIVPNPSSSRVPKSPWMPFSMLFAAISHEVPSKNMDLVNANYELFKVFFFLCLNFFLPVFNAGVSPFCFFSSS